MLALFQRYKWNLDSLRGGLVKVIWWLPAEPAWKPGFLHPAQYAYIVHMCVCMYMHTYMRAHAHTPPQSTYHTFCVDDSWESMASLVVFSLPFKIPEQPNGYQFP